MGIGDLDEQNEKACPINALTRITFSAALQKQPITPDYYQRDLLTDNIVGLCRELVEKDTVSGRTEIGRQLDLTIIYRRNGLRAESNVRFLPIPVIPATPVGA